MVDSINQSHNSVRNGDIVGGDKYLLIKKEVARATSVIRSDLGFIPDCDSNNTTLLSKLEAGHCTKNFKDYAIWTKIRTLGVLLDMSKTEHGKEVIADIYDNLLAVINTKYIADMGENELLKHSMNEIYSDLTSIVTKYEGIVSIDEAFLSGLLYIATSNCAIRWIMENSQ